MARSKFVVLCALAALGICVVYTFVASAEEKVVTCHTDQAGGVLEKDSCLFKAGTEQIRTEVPLTGKLEGATAKLKVSGGPDISCSTVKASGRFVAQSDGVALEPLTLTFEACHVEGMVTECEVVTPITATFKGQFFKPTEIVFVEKGLGPIAEITIHNVSGCTVAVTGAKLVGNQKCTAPTSIEREGLDDIITCPETGSDLEYAGKDAKLSIEERVELESKQAWAIGKS